MKITDLYLSFPPHLIVGWQHVSAIQGDPLPNDLTRLTIYLSHAGQITLPEISTLEATAIFNAFQRFQENRPTLKIRMHNLSAMTGERMLPEASVMHTMGPISYDQLSRTLQHDPQQKDLPALPNDVLLRIAHTARVMFTNEEGTLLPQPRPHCHCMYCQIARAIQGGMEQSQDVVSEDDLRLCEWKIQQIVPDRYIVSSASDPLQEHEVHLKPTVSCSCGLDHCVHVEAVLRS